MSKNMKCLLRANPGSHLNEAVRLQLCFSPTKDERIQLKLRLVKVLSTCLIYHSRSAHTQEWESCTGTKASH